LIQNGICFGIETKKNNKKLSESLFFIFKLKSMFAIYFGMNKKEFNNKMKSETFKLDFWKQKENILYKTEKSFVINF
jgi:hypothetical protein